MCINFKLIALELSIVLVPLYSVVYLADKMFDIAFILAAALVVSSSIENLPSKKMWVCAGGRGSFKSYRRDRRNRVI